MSIYRYKAISANGEKTEGTVFVENYDEAYNYLHSRNQYPMCIEKAKLSNKEISVEDLLSFFLHMDLQLKCKVRVDEAIISFLEVHGNKVLKSSLESIIHELKKGVSLGEAFEMHAPVFDSVIISLLKSAEKTGNVSEVIENILSFLKMQNDWKNNVKDAIKRPIFILIFICIMLVFSATFIGPQIISLMQTIGTEEVPILTEMTMSILRSVPNFALIFLAFLFCSIALMLNSEWRQLIWSAVLKIPLVGDLIIGLNFWQFSKIFHISLDAKLNFVDAFNLATETMKLSILRLELKRVLEKIKDGYSISESFANTKFVPRQVVSAMDIGEEGSDLAASFRQLSEKQYVEILMNINSLGQNLSDGIRILAGLILILIICAFLFPIYSYIEIAGT